MTLTGFFAGGSALALVVAFTSREAAIALAAMTMFIVLAAAIVCMYALRIGAPVKYRQLGERGNHRLTLGRRASVEDEHVDEDEDVDEDNGEDEEK